MNEIQFFKFLIILNGAIPLSLLFWDWYFGKIGANPIEFLIRTTGVMTLSFLLVTLFISPIRKLFKWNQGSRLRRTLGLYAFFYGSTHLITYSIFDKSLDLPEIIRDVWQRPFIAFGMTALTLMSLLAITSTNGMIKWLGGKRWQQLHRLIYPIAILGVIHYYLIQKSDVSIPILYGVILFGLLAFRIIGALGNKK